MTLVGSQVISVTTKSPIDTGVADFGAAAGAGVDAAGAGVAAAGAATVGSGILGSTSYGI